MDTSTQAKSLPGVLSFSDLRYYIFSSVFTLLAVFIPWFLHKFSLLGPQFLPMHFFVLVAGLLFGWRAGLAVGVISPLMSYGLSHLPPLMILPQIVLELGFYGLAMGVLREKGLGFWFSLLLAMILGRLARFMVAGSLEFIAISWPGIVSQLVLIPLFILVWKRISRNS